MVLPIQLCLSMFLIVFLTKRMKDLILKVFRELGQKRLINTPGLNFINVLHTAFTRVDPKSVKRYCRLD